MACATQEEHSRETKNYCQNEYDGTKCDVQHLGEISEKLEVQGRVH